MSHDNKKLPKHAIALVGMAGRFPGARDVDTLWQNMLNAREGAKAIPAEELDPSIPEELRQDPAYVPFRGVMPDFDRFDAAFFGISPMEAQVMDPQQRVLLELAYAALEDSGHCGGGSTDSRVGIYLGANWNRYRRHCLDSRPDVVESFGDFATSLANEPDFLATRISHKLDLHGPSATLSSACSTSLVAIVEAAKALLNGSCDLVLAGGASITVPTMAGYRYEAGGMLSRDGHCKPFDADGTGTTFSDGAAVVVLRRLEDALRDGDQIHAVMRGFAVNNDGGDKVSFSAPSLGGQAEVLRAAYEHAEVSPSTIGYIETHGTATPMGDPIEVAALARVFEGCETACALGSVKSGVGHLVHAAGVTGFLMGALAVKHGVIPATLHFQTPNPRLQLERTPFYVSPTARRWPEQDYPRRAGVSSFGVGGTNAHVVLEQPPAAHSTASTTGTAAELLCFSAKTPAALGELITAARAQLAQQIGEPGTLRNAAFTLRAGRKQLPQRAAFVLTADEAAGEWPQACAEQVAEHSRSLYFTFPGLGVERAGMAAALYEADPNFRAEIDRCLTIVRELGGGNIEDALLCPSAEADIRDLRIAKPALFIFEYALARSLEAQGLQADALLGCSLGEFTAGTCAGIFSLRDAIQLLLALGAQSEAALEGRLVTAYCTEAELNEIAHDGVSIAAVHARDVLALAGTPDAVDKLVAQLQQAGIRVESLNGDHPFHSPLMSACAEALEGEIKQLELRAPSRRLISASLGKVLTDVEATDPGYWARIISEPIRFSDALDSLSALNDGVLLEVGPGGSLSALAMLHPVAASRSPIATLPNSGFGNAFAETLQAVAKAWAHGVEFAKPAAAHQDAQRISLPTYPFARTRHWVEPGERRPTEASQSDDPLAGEASSSSKSPSDIPDRLRDVIEQASGIELCVDSDEAWAALDFDSLDLTQLAIALRREFECEVTFRDLMERHSSPRALSTWLGANTAASTETSSEDSPEPEPNEQPNDEPTEGGMPSRSGPSTKIERSTDTLDGLSPEQRDFLADFFRDYATRTAGSKASVQANREKLADPRVVSGFDPAWKEIVYPIVTERSRGSRLWDIDGNEYVDFTNGYGSVFFGHSPDFVTEAVREQLDKGIEIGPLSALTGEVAQLLCELTGNERITFANTGSEAVMAALRIARTVTGRDKVVMFEGAYHGVNDQVVVRPGPGGRGMPGAPGIPRSHVGEVIVLPYGEDASLAQIEKLGSQLAGVLVEPVQSRRPSLQPKEFLHKLRLITKEQDSALIFDEVVTGFRTHPGGIRALYGIDADMSTYGKVLGGGYPIGIVAGSHRFLDTLDGGAWQFGDDSIPEVGVTFFAGTFVRHPIALAATRAVLRRLRAAGPELQAERGQRMTRLTETINAEMQRLNAPVQVESFYSVAYMRVANGQRWSSLIYAGLRHRGFHIWEGFPFFLTTSHSEAELDSFVQALSEVVSQLMQVGLLQSEAAPTPEKGPAAPVPGARLGRRPDGTVAWFVPDEEQPGRYRELPEQDPPL
ncbi:MAG: hypothetical protein CSA62_13120 [Planctomycetota bacterium]|nr:MAG: hypothetical protein CSA62_13120 [Planctomycetota bacterium]